MSACDQEVLRSAVWKTESITVVKLTAPALQRVGPSVMAQIVFLVGVVFRGSDFENGSNARPVDRLAVPVSRPSLCSLHRRTCGSEVKGVQMVGVHQHMAIPPGTYRSYHSSRETATVASSLAEG